MVKNTPNLKFGYGLATKFKKGVFYATDQKSEKYV